MTLQKILTEIDRTLAGDSINLLTLEILAHQAIEAAPPEPVRLKGALYRFATAAGNARLDEAESLLAEARRLLSSPA